MMTNERLLMPSMIGCADSMVASWWIVAFCPVYIVPQRMWASGQGIGLKFKRSGVPTAGHV